MAPCPIHHWRSILYIFLKYNCTQGLINILTFFLGGKKTKQVCKTLEPPGRFYNKECKHKGKERHIIKLHNTLKDLLIYGNLFDSYFRKCNGEPNSQIYHIESPICSIKSRVIE